MLEIDSARISQLRQQYSSISSLVARIPSRRLAFAYSVLPFYGRGINTHDYTNRCRAHREHRRTHVPFYAASRCARLVASTFYAAARPHLRPRPQRLGAASHMMPHIVWIVHRRGPRESERHLRHWYVVAGTVRSVGCSDSKLHLKRFILHLEMYCISNLRIRPRGHGASAQHVRVTH